MPEPGYDIPARIGDPVDAIATPALILDLDVFEANLDRMRADAERLGVDLRAHAKMHKSADIARLQMTRGGAVGVCCQKVSEAEALIREGIADILVTNEVVGAARLARLVRLAQMARIAVIADHPEAVAALSRAVLAAREAGAPGDLEVEVLVEMECGGNRCGTIGTAATVALAEAIAASPGLRFGGLHSYFGSAQHVADPQERAGLLARSTALTAEARDAILAAGLPCPRVTGAGTGTYETEGASGVYTEIQPGSYAVMDADYNRVRRADGSPPGGFGQALFVLATVISTPAPGRAVCDAGLKALAVDSGPPVAHGVPGVAVGKVSDEHCTLDDPEGRLKLGDMIRLIPGHCDPTCNLHDWYAGLRGGLVETLWPVTARGKVF
ncbi:DSD1 family PLP-dependent enzyme [Mangrovicoccus sp. HB161399]|uniref:DSD1 family PLP-dependent enzyme n=1 Tax=Mangrovicoccus sp. HB161399 TaxID=2720392 RepID=UPI001552A5E2|nr:DSD1 family PLP-dependent enzyme [Mangrovicoccus sp. HB161399]